MKKAFVMITSLIVIIFLVGCSSNDEEDFYGIYTFEKVSYLSPLSSSTIDYINKQMEGTKYTIKADLFKAESANYDTIEVNSPNYVREEIPDVTSNLIDIRSFLGKEVEWQYTVGTTHKRLYVSPDSMWIASYVDNTADGSEIIMYVYQLTKNK